MSRTFKTLSGKKEVDVTEYVKQYLSDHRETQILIGRDSQNHGKETVYALVVGLYTPGKGAHVLFEKRTEPRDKSYQPGVKSTQIETARLLNEVWLSVELAELFKSEGLPLPVYIDIDVNDDKKYGSNKVLASAVGLVVGMGYNVRHKGQYPMMTYMSDHLVK